MPKRRKKVLVTGGAGFIGSEFVRQNTGKYRIAITDKLTYAGDLKRLSDVKGKFTFYRVDITNKKRLKTVFAREKPEIIVHFAAETHVDRSLHIDPKPFMITNILGTKNLIDLSAEYKVKRFLHISTDEVYGSIKNGLAKETAILNPKNPYAASKASADLLILTATKTLKFPAMIIRPSNVYGPWQYPEKFIPVIIAKALYNSKVPVYGDGSNIREWLYLTDCAQAISFLLKKGKTGQIYNVGSAERKSNLHLAKRVINLLGKSTKLIRFMGDRPGHDSRYALNTKKISALGWRPQTRFENGLKDTVEWYQGNTPWLKTKLKQVKPYWKVIYSVKQGA